MGAAASMYYGYQYGRTLAGIFALSGFLNTETAVYEVITIHMIDIHVLVIQLLRLGSISYNN